MNNKKTYKKTPTREERLFPYLSMSISERLKNSNTIDLKNNYTIVEENGYWTIKPNDFNKKK